MVVFLFHWYHCFVGSFGSDRSQNENEDEVSNVGLLNTESIQRYRCFNFVSCNCVF